MHFTNMYCKKETSTKYLGVTIQTDLKWNKHVNNITASATQKLNFIKRHLRVNSKTVKERAYTSLVRPKLEYSNNKEILLKINK